MRRYSRLLLFTEVPGRCVSAKVTRSPSTLSECSQNCQPYWAFSGLGDCPNNLILPFPSPEKVRAHTYEVIPRVDYPGTFASHGSPLSASAIRSSGSR
jgi:hypothetical protein